MTMTAPRPLPTRRDVLAAIGTVTFWRGRTMWVPASLPAAENGGYSQRFGQDTHWSAAFSPDFG
jgi:hypothetical protein